MSTDRIDLTAGLVEFVPERTARTVISWRQRLSGIYEFSDHPGRILSMEGVRGLAVILVFFTHFHGHFGHYAPAHSYSFALSRFAGTIGHTGVDLFFVLSGHLIYGAAIRTPFNYRRFMRRRIKRIYPPFLAILAIYLALSLVAPSVSKIPSRPIAAAGYILANIMLLPGIFNIQPMITVAWSLSFEFFYYLTIPLLVGIMGMRGWRRWQRVGFFISLAVISFASLLRTPDPYPRFVMFLSGILLYEALGSTIRPRGGRMPGESVALLAFLGSFPLIFMIWTRRELLSFLPGINTLGGGYGVLVMFGSFFAFAYFCFGQDGVLNQLFSWTPLRWLGNISYSFYLSHGLVLHLISKSSYHVFPHATHSLFMYWSILLFAIAATVIFSTFLFILVEKPFSLHTEAPRREG